MYYLRSEDVSEPEKICIIPEVVVFPEQGGTTCVGELPQTSSSFLREYCTPNNVSVNGNGRSK
jgi:hypothetical protein